MGPWHDGMVRTGCVTYGTRPTPVKTTIDKTIFVLWGCNIYDTSRACVFGGGVCLFSTISLLCLLYTGSLQAGWYSDYATTAVYSNTKALERS